MSAANPEISWPRCSQCEGGWAERQTYPGEKVYVCRYHLRRMLGRPSLSDRLAAAWDAYRNAKPR